MQSLLAACQTEVQIDISGGNRDIVRCADGFYLERCNDAQPWTYSQKPVEIIIHKEYNKKVKKGKVQFQRKDHDIALLRMEYPIWDYKTGLGYK